MQLERKITFVNKKKKSRCKVSELAWQLSEGKIAEHTF